MLSKNHCAAWLYYSAAIQKEKIEVLKKKKKKKVAPSPSLQPQNGPEKGGQGLFTHVVSIIHS